jgi:pilus assembly protein CpaC
VTVNAERIPGLRVRSVDTAVEMRAGQTLALAGLIQHRVEAQNRGLPWLADLPWLGAAFRRVDEEMNEIELVITVRPELVDALDPHQVPQCGPGETLTSPNDVDLFWRGYLEVPRCCQDGSCLNCRGQEGMPAGYQDLPPISIEPPATAPTTAPAPPAIDAAESAPAFPGSIQPVHSGSNGAPGLSHPRKWAAPISYPSRESAAAAPTPDRPNPDIPAHTSNPTNVARGKTVGADPGIFGPIGYDVLDLKE